MKKKNSINGQYFNQEELKEINFKKCGKNVLISKLCTIINANKIEIKNNVRIDDYSVIIGGENSNLLKLGSYVHISSFCFLNAKLGIEMKDYSGIGLGVKMFTINDDFSGRGMTNPTTPKGKKKLKTGSIVIGKAVNIGVNTTIMPGTKIGNYSSVGSYSFVTGILKTGYVYYGNPVQPLYKKFSRLKELIKSRN